MKFHDEILEILNQLLEDGELRGVTEEELNNYQLMVRWSNTVYSLVRDGRYYPKIHHKVLAKYKF